MPDIWASKSMVPNGHLFSVPDPDADPRIRTSDSRIRMRIRTKMFNDF
jgi:hypothetical protein